MSLFDEEVAYFKECERQDLERKYPVGTKLLCVDDGNQSTLVRGRSYTVMKLDRNRVYVNENKRFSFLLTRFRVINNQELRNEFIYE